MTYYHIPKLEALLKEIQPKTADPVWLLRHLRLRGALAYFQYAVASIRSQQESLELYTSESYRGKPKDVYEDILTRIYAHAVSAYAHMRTCLRFTRELIDEVSEAAKSTAFESFREEHRSWIEILVERRNRVSAHSEKSGRMVIDPYSWSDRGIIRFHVLNEQNPTKSPNIELRPNEDFTKLWDYLDGLSDQLRSAWQ